MPRLKSKTKAKPQEKRGPKEERVKIDEDWKTAIKNSFFKKRPKGGWPN
jgi:hypothetical protein